MVTFEIESAIPAFIIELAAFYIRDGRDQIES